MRKIIFLCLTLSLVAVAGGCKKKEIPQTESATETVLVTEAETVETEAVTEPETTKEEIPEYLDRKEAKELVYYNDGIEKKVKASLFTTDSYSLYILDEGFEHSREEMDGFNVNVWKNTEAKAPAALKIIELKGKNMMEAQEYIKSVYSAYGLTEDKQGGLGGMNAKEEMLYAGFHNSDGNIYALILSYPASQTEGIGAGLIAMADTFRS